MSNYSPSLRAELIQPGNQAGAWGTTTNDNFAYVFDAAIAGAVTVTPSGANHVLTYLNGPTTNASLNESVRATLVLSGASTAFNLFAPNVPKQYVIQNNSGYTATIYNSSSLGSTTPGGTGVTIPNGAVLSVVSPDGANFVAQTNYWYSPAFAGVPTAPTAAYGTNTTQLATTAFVQAALQALYPVGSIYTSVVSTNPNTLFGFGNWSAIGQGRVLIGAGGSYPAGSTGGTADSIVVYHSHTASSSFSGNTLGAHSHTATDSGHTHQYHTGGSGSGNYTGSSSVWGGDAYPQTGVGFANISVSSTSAGTPSGTVSTSVDATGSSGAGANLPPYLVVYMWKRDS